MNLKEHINFIKPYFKGFNMDAETAYLIVEFPKNWRIIDEQSINSLYDVYTKVVDGNTYFVTDVENGADCLFNAVNDVISTNRDIEEKASLLKIKCKELSDLFISEPIEKLRTITFTFKTTSTRKTKKNNVKTEIKADTIEKETKEEVKNEKSAPEVENKTIKETPIATTPKKKANESKNMTFLKNVVGGK